MMEKYVTYLTLPVIILFAAIAATGCKAKQPTTPVERTLMKFDYTPPTEGIVANNGITFILMNPKFAEDEEQIDQDPFKTFANNMTKDFEEMMTQRGYAYKGPYDTYDELVYSEKKTADFILEVEIDYTWQGGQDALYNKNKTNYATKQTTTYYGFDGTVSLGGKVNLTLSEPQTETKLWTKSIPMSDQTFYLKSDKMYSLNNGKLNIPYSDIGMHNSIVPSLEKMYDKAMQTAWNHLDPAEMAVKKEEAEEIRNDAGFKKN